MYPVLIGSQALRNNHSGYGSTLSDYDFIVTEDQLKAFARLLSVNTFHPTSTGKFLAKLTTSDDHRVNVELELAIPGSSNWDIYNYVNENVNKTKKSLGIEYKNTPDNLLYAIKMSHRFRRSSVKRFIKTRDHIMLFRKLGVKLSDNLLPIYKKRFKESLNYKHPNLNTNKDGFFRDIFKYEHDTIHEAVAINKQPAYKYFQPKNSQVSVSKDKFFECTRLIQLSAVYEESAVLALERSLIPNNFKVNIDPFLTALTKVCTHTTSGWFREFAWENFDDVLCLKEDFDYIADFKAGIKNGIIKPRIIT